jgi:hypothetical protein
VRVSNKAGLICCSIFDRFFFLLLVLFYFFLGCVCVRSQTVLSVCVSLLLFRHVVVVVVFLSRNPQTSRHTQQLPTRAFRQAPALRLHRHSPRVCRSQLGGGNIVRTRIKDPSPKMDKGSIFCHVPFLIRYIRKHSIGE